MELSEDRQALDAYRRGDATVLRELYSQYAVEVAVAVRKATSPGLRSAFELDDVVQETFIRAFGEVARQRYDGLQPFRAYLLQIAKNLVIDGLRRVQRSHAIFATPAADAPDEPLAWREPDDAPTPEASAIDAQLRKTFEAFAAGLDAQDRQLLQLRFVEAKTRREVSEQTGLSAMQVRTREDRLRERLRQRLVGEGYLQLLQQLGAVLLALWASGWWS